MPQYDAIIIGTGQAGPSLAHRLAAAGQRVAVIERHRFGGTCVNTGCTPTKTLVASAYAAHLARRAGDYGVSVPGPITVDMRKVKARKDDVLGFSTRGVEKALRSNPMITVYQGHARLTAPHSVAVGGETVSAPKIFINVGGRAAVPDIPGIDQVEYLHEQHAAGRRVPAAAPDHRRRQLRRTRVRPDVPPLRQRGDGHRDGAAPRSRARTRTSPPRSPTFCGGRHRAAPRRRVISSSPSAATTSSRASMPAAATRRRRLASALAVGRRPNTDDLGLDKAGVAVDKRGYIEVDDQLQHQRAGHLGSRRLQRPRRLHPHLVQRFRDRRRQPARRRSRAASATASPPTPSTSIRRSARVGMTEAEVRKSGRPALIAKMAMKDVSRAVEKGETQGFMKILVDAETKQIPRRLHPRRQRRRGDPLDPRHDVRQGALHRHAASGAHPSDRLRAAPDHARRPQAPRLEPTWPEPCPTGQSLPTRSPGVLYASRSARTQARV